MVQNSLNTITNKLLEEYDLSFNKNYNHIVQLNSEIQNKEQLIINIHELILYKERYIIILQYIIYYLLSVGFLSLLYLFKFINKKELISLSILLLIIYSFVCYNHIKKYFNLYSLKLKINALKVNMKDYTKKILENTFGDYECPSKCELNKDNINVDINSQQYNNDNNDINDINDINDDHQLLKINPSLNVWKYGDISINDDLNTLEEITNKNNIDSSFGTSYPKSTYYECKWLGSNNNKGMPQNLKKNSSLYSTIPCNYKPNTTEIGKYICNKDPNEYGIDNCEKI